MAKLESLPGVTDAKVEGKSIVCSVGDGFSQEDALAALNELNPGLNAKVAE